jgi:hypothetical protein
LQLKMKEHSFDREFGPPAPPHFDDDWTLLSARPVVPLEQIEAKERHRRHWILGGAFAIAMMLGAASALVASYLKLRNVPNSVSEISEVETPTTPLAVTETMASQLPLAENGGEVPTEIPTIDEFINPVTPKKPRRKPAIRNNSDFTRPRVVREPDEQDELNRIREAVLFDSWQERRARRAVRRERRSRVDHHDRNRDLSNLDEIFEGPRRRPY